MMKLFILLAALAAVEVTVILFRRKRAARIRRDTAVDYGPYAPERS